MATEVRLTILDLDIAPAPAVRHRPVRPSRPVALFVLAMLTLVLVTASERLAQRVAGALWSGAYDRDNDTVTLTPTSIFLSHHGALTAYDLATGATRWSAPATGVMSQAPAVAGGVIVAPDGFERYFQRPDLVLARTTRTVARDAGTGSVLWRAAGAPQEVGDRSVLLVDAAGPVPRLRNVGLRDGRTLWSRPVPDLADAVVVGDSVVAAATDGRITVFRYGDGALTRTGKVPWPDRAWLSVLAGRLVVRSQASSGLTSSVVYRPDTLTELWRIDGNLTDCGVVLCGLQPGGLIGYDPGTGAQRWLAPGMTAATSVRADRIVAFSELDGRIQLIDPATGRVLGSAGAGPGSWFAGGRTAVAGVPVASEVFVLQSETAAPNRAAVVRLDLGTGGQRLAGAVDGTGWVGCRSAAGYLVCLRSDLIRVTAVA
jgi:outer membrane protein assembly factor BamB